MGLCVVLTMATDTLAQRPLSELEQRMPSHTLDNNHYDPSKPSLSGLEQRVIALEAYVAALKRARRAPVFVDTLGHVVGVVLDQADVFHGATNASQNKTVLFEAAVLMQIHGIPTIVHVTPSEITGFPSAGTDTPQINFAGPDCTGMAFVFGTLAATFGGRALFYAGNIYLPKPEPGVDRVLASRVIEMPTGDLVCENDTYRTVYTEALTVPVSIFDRFVPPFTLSGLPSLP
jgi:hypothetical protein